jgi:hypothetical protein
MDQGQQYEEQFEASKARPRNARQLFWKKAVDQGTNNWASCPVSTVSSTRSSEQAAGLAMSSSPCQPCLCLFSSNFLLGEFCRQQLPQPATASQPTRPTSYSQPTSPGSPTYIQAIQRSLTVPTRCLPLSLLLLLLLLLLLACLLAAATRNVAFFLTVVVHIPHYCVGSCPGPTC